VTVRAVALGCASGTAAASAGALSLWRRYLDAGSQVRRFAEATHGRLADVGAVDRLDILPWSSARPRPARSSAK
jgi:hypothetical protein